MSAIVQLPDTVWSKSLIGGSACAISSSILNPMDVVKTRMQNVATKSTFLANAISIVRAEGIIGLYRGLPASIIREMTYSAMRFGAYDPICHRITSLFNRSKPIPADKYAAALLSGALGAAFANPTDLVKVKFQAQLPHEVLPYRTTLGAFIYIFRTTGITGLYKGGSTTTARAALLTSAQLGSYDTIKSDILKKYFPMNEGIGLHFAASMLTGIVTTTVSNPSTLDMLLLDNMFSVDVIKTRYMSDAGGLYKSPYHCTVSCVRQHGWRIFFAGWTPSYFRVGPHTVICFMLMEQARRLFGMRPI